MHAARDTLSGLSFIELQPEAARGDLPLVVGLHGRGASGEDIAGLCRHLDASGYRYLCPDAPLVMDLGGLGTGYTWYDLGPSQPADIARGRARLEAFLREALPRFGATPARTMLLGFSQGAVMALEVGLRSPEPYAGLVAMSGYLPEPADIEAALPAAAGRQILVVHGSDDEVVPVAAARAAVRVLEGGGLQPEYHEFPIGHAITLETLTVVRGFLHRVLPPG